MQVRRKKTSYSGLALIETAIVFPILLLITLGVIHFAWLFLKAQQITNAARQGARIGARLDGTEQEVRSAICSLMTSAGLPYSDGYVTISWPTLPDGRSGIAVQVKVPGATVAIPNLSTLLPTPDNIRAAVTMAKEGS